MTSPTLERRRWTIGVLLGVGILINYFDRVNISVAAPQLQQEFNLTPDTFRTSLVANTLIGRYDARVSAPVGSPLADDGDPSSTFITQPFTQAITGLLDGFLGYGHGADYALSG